MATAMSAKPRIFQGMRASTSLKPAQAKVNLPFTVAQSLPIGMLLSGYTLVSTSSQGMQKEHLVLISQQSSSALCPMASRALESKSCLLSAACTRDNEEQACDRDNSCRVYWFTKQLGERHHTYKMLLGRKLAQP